MLVLGVDPGLKGAIALVDTDLHVVRDYLDMPLQGNKVNAGDLHSMIRKRMLCAETAVIELVSSRPRQAGAFNFGFNTGIVHGVLVSLGLDVRSVTPSIWKPAMGLMKTPGETVLANKTRARALASALFPGSAHLFQRVKDDGRAEAALLAYYRSKISAIRQIGLKARGDQQIKTGKKDLQTDRPNLEIEEDVMANAYYFKDRDHLSQTIYILILDGQRVGQTSTKREAEAWFRAQSKA